VSLTRSDLIKYQELLYLGMYVVPEPANCTFPPEFLIDTRFETANCTSSIWVYCPDYMPDDVRDVMLDASRYYEYAFSFDGMWSGIMLPLKALTSMLKPITCLLYTPTLDAFFRLFVFNPATCVFDPIEDLAPGYDACLVVIWFAIGSWVAVVGIAILITFITNFIAYFAVS